MEFFGGRGKNGEEEEVFPCGREKGLDLIICRTNLNFTITTEIHARSLANSYCQYVEAQWPNGQCFRSRSEWSGFELWSGTLCCVLGQDI